jgi:hypothetical protein
LAITTSLDTLFTLPPSYTTMLTIIKEHGGLVDSFYRSFGNRPTISPYEIKSIMWEALPIAIEEYDPSLGKASTCWGKVTRRLMARVSRERCTKGSVKVPINNKDRYSSVSQDSKHLEEALERYLEEYQDRDDV